MSEIQTSPKSNSGFHPAERGDEDRALACSGAGPWQRTEQRRGYANGYKDHTLKIRLGKLELKVPQVRGDVKFHPSALKRGQRSEPALKSVLAEMSVQGVSTRRGTEILKASRCSLCRPDPPPVADRQHHRISNG